MFLLPLRILAQQEPCQTSDVPLNETLFKNSGLPFSQLLIYAKVDFEFEQDFKLCDAKEDIVNGYKNNYL